MENKLEVLDESLIYFSKKKSVLFIGAGISRIAGCDNWETIIEKLLNERNLFADIDPKDFITSKRQNNEKIQFLKERYFEKGKKDKFYAVLREATTPDPSIYNKKYIPFIKSLKNINPFPILMTTNIDSCIEDSRQLNFERIYYETDDFKKENLKEGSIFHIHGYRENFSSSLFSNIEYQKRYNNKSFKEFINYIFKNYCIIFIGYSLSDNELNQLLNICNKKNGIKNYILVPKNEFSEADIALNRELYNLHTVEYGEVEEFPEIFSSWIIKKFTVERPSIARRFKSSLGRKVN